MPSRRIRPACKARSTGNCRHNGLAAIASHPALTIAAISAAGLVLSSADFGATYAWTTASQHGLPLGACAVLMAVALEGAKPLAVAAALVAFRAWAILRGLMLALLAVAAMAFSLTSELALIGGTRGDLAAKRASVVEQHEARRARLQDARTELSSLAPSRPVAEIEADVAKLLADNPRAGDCHIMDGPVSRLVCPQVAALNGEIDRTRRRFELQAAIAKLTDAIPTAAIGTADPASATLSSYFGALGRNIPASVIADWLVLIPVLALELGAALAVVLVDAVAAGSKAEAATADAVPLTVSRPETVSTALLPAPCSGDDQLLEALARAGRPLRNDELARAMRVSPGEASKRRRAVEHLLDVERRGRTVLVSLAARRH